jgi:DNA-3-methyladenine glycosylase I
VINRVPPNFRRDRGKGDVPAVTRESNAMSKISGGAGSGLSARPFYAFMQSVGLVNDHVVTCFRYAEL